MLLLFRFYSRFSTDRTWGYYHSQVSIVRAPLEGVGSIFLPPIYMMRPRLKVADRDETSMAYNLSTKNRKKKKLNDRMLVLVMRFSSITAEF